MVVVTVLDELFDEFDSTLVVVTVALLLMLGWQLRPGIAVMVMGVEALAFSVPSVTVNTFPAPSEPAGVELTPLVTTQPVSAG
jgi:hypothetical protein